MPQLDIYIICNMLYGVIILFIFAYMLNINNILIIINILLRLRKLKLFLEKKYIFKNLQYILKKKNVIIYKFYGYFLSLKLNILKKIIFVENIKDIRNLKQSDLKINDWMVKLFK